ncbi:hypothetical protein EPO34_01795 [Patescibacteria group bacterium]|nr:MAG: hypothetical protein EPO34_01795 [Patescibacteria group bacterium]
MNAPLPNQSLHNLDAAIDAIPDTDKKVRRINIDQHGVQPLEVVALLKRLVAISEHMTPEHDAEFRALMAPMVMAKYARFNEAIRDIGYVATCTLKQPAIGINEDYSLEDGRTVALRLLVAAQSKGDVKILDEVFKTLLKHDLVSVSDLKKKR